MEVTGVIHNVSAESKIFSMIINNRLEYFYLQNSLRIKFNKYLHKGRFVSFSYTEEKKRIGKVQAYSVDHFNKIIRKSRFKAETYYDLDTIRSGIKDFFNSFDNVMFLDLEMTMQDYYSNSKFVPEVIQAGFLICNKNGEVIYDKSIYIKPTKSKRISKRTYKFLNIKPEVFDDACRYKEFYDILKNIIDKYNPYILVWGKNDILVLKDSFVVNNMKPLELRFVNLLQIIKNYYNLKQDLGLFKALKMFKGIENDQAHDALDDAIVTKDVFYSFKQIISE